MMNKNIFINSLVVLAFSTGGIVALSIENKVMNWIKSEKESNNELNEEGEI